MGLSHLFLLRSAVNLLANLVNSARNDCRVKRMDEGKKFSNKEKSFTYPRLHFYICDSGYDDATHTHQSQYPEISFLVVCHR